MPDLLKPILLHLHAVIDVDIHDIVVEIAVAVEYKPIFQGWVAVVTMHHPTVSDPSDMMHTSVTGIVTGETKFYLAHNIVLWMKHLKKK